MVIIYVQEGVAYVRDKAGHALFNNLTELRVYYKQQKWALAHEGTELDCIYTDECTEGDQCRSWHPTEKCKGGLRAVAMLRDPNGFLHNSNSKEAALKFYAFMRDKTVFDEECLEPHWRAFVKLNTYNFEEE